MSLDAIRAEFLEVGIGPALYRQIVATARAILPRYNPSVYLRSVRWEDGLDDFVQEFICIVLLEDGQLQYAIDHASDERHFWGLIGRQMRRLLARRRQRTVVDNLLDRSRELVNSSPFAFEEVGHAWRYWLEDRPVAEAAGCTEDLLAATAAQVASFEVIRAEGSERAPTVYTTDRLRQILIFVAVELNCRVSQRQLDRIFRRALTFLLPSDLSINQEGASTVADETVDAETKLRIEEAAGLILRTLSPEERVVLKMKIENHSDSEVAAETFVSRPTVDKRKREAINKIAFAVEDFEYGLQKLVLDVVAAALLVEGEQ